MADFTFYPYDNAYAGVPKAEGSISGSRGDYDTVTSIATASGSISGSAIIGLVFSGQLSAVGTVDFELDIDHVHNNWVMWSKIGELSFTFDRVNDAGSKPMSWPGFVWHIEPLEVATGGTSKGCFVVYGSHGVTLMFPVTEPMPTFAFRDIYPLGLGAKGLITGDPNGHYFIDNKWQLCSLAGGDLGKADPVKVLGYSEILNILAEGSYPVMHYDAHNQRVLVCNNNKGFTYTKDGLGGGPTNLTAVRKDGLSVLYTAPSTINYQNVNLLTNTTDCGSKSQKAIQSIVISATDPTVLQYQLHYRHNTKEAFKTTAWKNFNKWGEGFVNRLGLEFRVGVRSLTPVATVIDGLHLQLKLTDRGLKQGVAQ